MNDDVLTQNLSGALSISLGIISAEAAIDNEKGRFFFAAIGLILFVAGWGVFLKDSPTKEQGVGAGIAVVAVLGQIYFSRIVKMPPEQRRKKLKVTVLVWMAFMALWIGYVYLMYSRTETNLPIYGLCLLMLGMMGYFFTRKNDWNTLTGGAIPKIDTGIGEFNPFIVFVAFGWAFLAVANGYVSSLSISLGR